MLLNLPADARHYDMCTIMLDYLRIKEVRLITNNPLKVNSLKNLGINVVDRVSITVGLNIFNKGYLQTKQERMSHMYEEIDFK